MIVDDLRNPALYSVVIEGERINAGAAMGYLGDAAKRCGGTVHIVRTAQASTDERTTHDMLTELPEAGVRFFEGFMGNARGSLGVRADIKPYEGNLQIAKGNLLFSLTGDNATEHRNAVSEVRTLVTNSGGKVVSSYGLKAEGLHTNIHAEMPARMLGDEGARGREDVSSEGVAIATRNNTAISTTWSPTLG